MIDWLRNVLIFVLVIIGLVLVSNALISFGIALSDGTFDAFCKKIKNKLTQNNDDYKDFVRTTESYGRVVELPFSVVQPLLSDDSPIILVAQNDRLVIKDNNDRFNNIYIKFSKEDYNKYIRFLEQKKVNKQILKKTEDTLAATRLINKELKRINNEAMTSVADETEKIKNGLGTYGHLSFDETHKEFREIMDSYKSSIEHISNDGELLFAIHTEEAEKFDQELLDAIWNGQTVIIIRDEYEHNVFKNCRFDKVVHFYNATIATGVKPLCARYYQRDNQWIIGTYDAHYIERIGVNVIELSKRCPDFAEKFKRRIKMEERLYDRL